MNLVVDSDLYLLGYIRLGYVFVSKLRYVFCIFFDVFKNNNNICVVCFMLKFIKFFFFESILVIYKFFDII